MVRALAGDSTMTSLYDGLRVLNSIPPNRGHAAYKNIKRKKGYQPFLILSRTFFEIRGKFLHYMPVLCAGCGAETVPAVSFLFSLLSDLIELLTALWYNRDRKKPADRTRSISCSSLLNTGGNAMTPIEQGCISIFSISSSSAKSRQSV